MEDKIKSNIQYRNKVIIGALFFVALMIIGIVGVIAVVDKREAQNQQEQVVKKEMVSAVVPSDTTMVVPDKSTIYKYQDIKNLKDNSDEIQVFKDESIVGKTQEEIDKKEKEQEDEISEYMKKRRSSMAETRTERHERQYQEIVERKERGSRGFDREKIAKQEQELKNYQTAREQQQQEQGKRTEKSYQNKNKASSFENLSQLEKRRILLETGLSEYRESEEISAMIISSGEVKAGQTITLQLKEDAYLKFKKIPKGTTLSGIVSFNESRMQVTFSTIRVKKKIIKVNLTLYGLDGLAGLPLGNDIFQKDIQDVGYNEVYSEDITGTKAERIIKKIGSIIKTKKEIKVDLGRDIMCLLVNNDVN